MIDNFHESPFEHEHPIMPDKFKGCEKDFKKIVRYMPKVINQGMMEHFFVIGKRETGKTSFVKYVASYVAEQFQMIPVYVNNTSFNSLDNLIKLLLETLFKELDKETWGRTIIRNFIDNVEEIKIKDTELIDNVKHDFAEFLINISSKLEDKNKGIFIIIDDVNGLTEDEHFTYRYKSFTEKVNFSETNVPITFTLVSYPDKFTKLCSKNDHFQEYST